MFGAASVFVNTDINRKGAVNDNDITDVCGTDSDKAGFRSPPVERVVDNGTSSSTFLSNTTTKGNERHDTSGMKVVYPKSTPASLTTILAEESKTTDESEIVDVHRVDSADSNCPTDTLLSLSMSSSIALEDSLQCDPGRITENDFDSTQQTRKPSEYTESELYRNLTTKEVERNGHDLPQLRNHVDDNESFPNTYGIISTRDSNSQSTTSSILLSEERQQLFPWEYTHQKSFQQNTEFFVPTVKQGEYQFQDIDGNQVKVLSRDRTLSEPGNIRDLLSDEIDIRCNIDIHPTDKMSNKTELRRRKVFQNKTLTQSEEFSANTKFSGNRAPILQSSTSKHVRRRRAVTTGADMLRNYLSQSTFDPRSAKNTTVAQADASSNEVDENDATIEIVPLLGTEMHDSHYVHMATHRSSNPDQQPSIHMTNMVPTSSSTLIQTNNGSFTNSSIRYRLRADDASNDVVNHVEVWRSEVHQHTSEQAPTSGGLNVAVDNDSRDITQMTTIDTGRNNNNTDDDDAGMDSSDSNSVIDGTRNSSHGIESNDNNNGNDNTNTSIPTRADSERWARHRWMQINRRFQLVIALVAVLFSLLLFAILIAWVVLTSAYVVSLRKVCDLGLRSYYWFATLQLLLDIYRTDIMRFVFQWDSNSGQRIPTRVIVYNVMYVFYAFLVLRLGYSSCFEVGSDSSCRQTAPFFFNASAVFVSLSMAAWITIICGYLIPFCVVACLLTWNGYSPSSLVGSNDARNGAGQAVFPTANGAPPECIERISIISLCSFPNHYPKECCICMEDFKEHDVLVHTTCLHVFHKTCCKEWLQQSRTCPICRDDIAAANGFAALDESQTNHDSNNNDNGAGTSLPMIPIGPSTTGSRPAVVGLIRMIQQNVSSNSLVQNGSERGRTGNAADSAGNTPAPLPDAQNDSTSSSPSLRMSNEQESANEMTTRITLSFDRTSSVGGSTSNYNDQVSAGERRSQPLNSSRNVAARTNSTGDDVEQGITI